MVTEGRITWKLKFSFGWTMLGGMGGGGVATENHFRLSRCWGERGSPQSPFPAWIDLWNGTTILSTINNFSIEFGILSEKKTATGFRADISQTKIQSIWEIWDDVHFSVIKWCFLMLIPIAFWKIANKHCTFAECIYRWKVWKRVSRKDIGYILRRSDVENLAEVVLSIIAR